jgi:transposase-like protein
MTDTPNKPTLKAERLASGGSVISHQLYDYTAHFDPEADRKEFLRVSHMPRPKAPTRSVEQRIAIGGQVIDGETTIQEAAAEHSVAENTIRDWMRKANGARMQKRTEEKIDRARELREMGCTDKYICAAVPIARKALVSHLGEPTHSNCRRLDPEEREAKKAEAAKLLAKGWSYQKIALKLGVSRQAVRYWFKSGDTQSEAKVAA